MNELKKSYPDATHYTYAYIIGSIKRANDDGEPSGTAGIPILKVLESNNLTYEFTISNICENYIGDYIYMSKETYSKSIGKYSINTQYLKFKDITKENEIMSNIKNNNSLLSFIIHICAVLWKSPSSCACVFSFEFLRGLLFSSYISIYSKISPYFF